MKDLLRYRKAGAGGPKAKWEMHLYRLDANWDTQSVDATGKPIFNEIDDMNLFLAADLACRVSMECYHKGMTLTKLAMRAGRAFQVQLWAKLLQETNAGKSFVNSLKFITRQDSTDPLTRQERAMKIAKDRGYKEEDWDEAEILRVGTVMWNAVLMGGDIFANDLTKLEDDLKPTYYPILKPEIQQLITEKNHKLALLEPMLTPMTQKPRDWGLENIGPYRTPELAQLVQMVKNSKGDQQKAIQDAKKDGSLNLPMQALSTLQNVPYVINQYVVQAVDWVSKDPERARLVSGFPNIKKTSIEKLDSKEMATKTRYDRLDIYQERKEAKADNREVDSNISMVNNWVETAKEYQDAKFYLPHQFDYRGRVYHAPEFGHHNTDCLRAMFYLANKKPIGDEFAWLSLALANNYGVDKVSMDMRQAWAEANEDVIRAAGRTYANETDLYDYWMYFDPDKGEPSDELHKQKDKITPFDFWRQGDEAFQFLAACHELAAIRSFEERNPGRGGEFISGLPIALDASQSGVQHFAAASKIMVMVNLQTLCPVPNQMIFTVPV